MEVLDPPLFSLSPEQPRSEPRKARSILLHTFLTSGYVSMLVLCWGTLYNGSNPALSRKACPSVGSLTGPSFLDTRHFPWH